MKSKTDFGETVVESHEVGTAFVSVIDFISKEKGKQGNNNLRWNPCLNGDMWRNLEFYS